MPMRAPRICTCGYKIACGERCPCQVQRAKQAERARPSARERGYDGRWERERAAYLRHHPLCQCGRSASHVDHIIPHKGNARLFWNRSNWQPMCHPCHSRKTATEDGGFGRPGGRVETFRHGGWTVLGPPRDISLNSDRGVKSR